MLNMKQFEEDLIDHLNDQLTHTPEAEKKYVQVIHKGKTVLVSLADENSARLSKKYQHKAHAFSYRGFDLNDLYEKYKQCNSVKEVAAVALQRLLSMETVFDVSVVADYSYVKKNMVIRCVNRANLSKLPPDIMHYDFSDICSYIQVRVMMGDTLKYVNLTYEMYKDYEIEKMQLFKDAIYSSTKLNPSFIRPFDKMFVMQYQGPASDSSEVMEEIKSIYYVSTRERVNGSAVLFYPSLGDELVERYKGNFYIVPVSVHECYVFPDTEKFIPSKFKSVLTDTNNQRDADENLSNHIFYYDVEKGSLSVCEIYDQNLKEDSPRFS